MGAPSLTAAGGAKVAVGATLAIVNCWVFGEPVAPYASVGVIVTLNVPLSGKVCWTGDPVAVLVPSLGVPLVMNPVAAGRRLSRAIREAPAPFLYVISVLALANHAENSASLRFVGGSSPLRVWTKVVCPNGHAAFV